MRILLVHDSVIVQKLLHHYFATEVADAFVRAADSTEAMASLRGQKYDLILCGTDMRRLNVQALRESLPGTPNWDTPFVGVLPRNAPDQSERLRAQGIHHQILIPFDPTEMGTLLGSMYDPRTRRGHSRFAPQGTEVSVDLGGVEVPASLVNVSMSGLLCEMDLPQTSADLFRTPHLSLAFSSEFGGCRAGAIRAGLTRLQVIAWTPARHATPIRTAWAFLNLPTAAQEVLGQVMAQVQRTLENAEAELDHS